MYIFTDRTFLDWSFFSWIWTQIRLVFLLLLPGRLVPVKWKPAFFLLFVLGTLDSFLLGVYVIVSLLITFSLHPLVLNQLVVRDGLLFLFLFPYSPILLLILFSHYVLYWRHLQSSPHHLHKLWFSTHKLLTLFAVFFFGFIVWSFTKNFFIGRVKSLRSSQPGIMFIARLHNPSLVKQFGDLAIVFSDQADQLSYPQVVAYFDPLQKSWQSTPCLNIYGVLQWVHLDQVTYSPSVLDVMKTCLISPNDITDFPPKEDIDPQALTQVNTVYFSQNSFFTILDKDQRKLVVFVDAQNKFAIVAEEKGGWNSWGNRIGFIYQIVDSKPQLIESGKWSTGYGFD